MKEPCYLKLVSRHLLPFGIRLALNIVEKRPCKKSINNRVFVIYHNTDITIIIISIYTLSDLGVLSNLIGSLSLANEHYSPPTE